MTRVRVINYAPYNDSIHLTSAHFHTNFSDKNQASKDRFDGLKLFDNEVNLSLFPFFTETESQLKPVLFT